ncbi:hypothetical protein PR202_gb12826 [Eleusine coracana subsp. coracana]|uniref:F-box protein AT5G49610-like beta-propeller domain-containing protein n=1 Tax=Eleusine coracana subsp. coracana TaxID=191504 RepID=A0AAV5ERK1_ELECO|nr:hypothetical protein PR202_gb12826 [Eleusine coracana subsp. coracana]
MSRSFIRHAPNLAPMSRSFIRHAPQLVHQSQLVKSRRCRIPKSANSKIEDDGAMSRRGCHHPNLPAPASPLDNDDILQGLVSNPLFPRRFRSYHRTPPLLGVYSGTDFVPTQDPPDQIPTARFSLDLPGDELSNGWSRYRVSCCRGGFVLYFDANEFLVFHPMSGDRHRVPIPMKDKWGVFPVTAAVVPLGADSSSANDQCLFRIVTLFSDISHGIIAFASVYSSDTGLWENSTGALSTEPRSSGNMILRRNTLVGNAIYWMFDRPGILQFDLDKQNLGVIEMSQNVDAVGTLMCQIIPTEGCQLGIAILAERSIQFWERKANDSRAVRWMLRKTVCLDNLLPSNRLPISLVGFAEESKVFFILTDGGVFMVHLDTMQSRKVLEVSEMSHIFLYSSF